MRNWGFYVAVVAAARRDDCASCEPIHATLMTQPTAKRANDRLTMRNSMRRLLPQLIAVAAVGIAFGVVYRYFLDDRSEARARLPWRRAARYAHRCQVRAGRTGDGISDANPP
jgi:hypothetical protein